MIPEALYQYRMVDQSDQSSIRNYDVQLANAIRISNRSLTACNPKLTESDCAEIRALYWEFQHDCVSAAGLSLVPETLVGFSERYGISESERHALIRNVSNDVLREMKKSTRVSADEEAEIRSQFKGIRNGLSRQGTRYDQ